MNSILLRVLDDIFAHARASALLAFVNGGFAIDFAYGRLTREHDDIDLLVEERDCSAWKQWFLDNGFQIQSFKSKSADFTCIMVRDAIHIDLGCVYFEGEKMLDHCDGYDRPYLWPQSRTETIHKAMIDGKEYWHISPQTAYFFKKNSTKTPREKDVHDMGILEEIVFQ